MHGMAEIKSVARRYLSNHRTSAEAVSRTMGLLTKPLRETNVTMFHIGRCGSTVVGMLLNQHPEIRWGGELFASLKKKYGRDSWVWENPLRMIRLRTNIHICKVFGIEIKKKHFEDVKMRMKRTIDELEKLEYERYIILKRNNYLKWEVSKIVGNRMKKWNFDEDVDPPKVKVPIKSEDGKGIVEYFQEVDRFYEKVESSIGNKNALKISYERDIKENPKKAFMKIVEWLGLKKVDVKVGTKKINKKDIEERIINYKEVRQALDRTEYEWMVRGA